MKKAIATGLKGLVAAVAMTAVAEEQQWAGYAVDSGAKGAAAKTTVKPPPADAPYRNPDLDVEKRIDDLLPRLMPEEKAKLLHAAGGLSP